MALITYLTRIQFDFGAIKLLEAELQLLGMRRPDPDAGGYRRRAAARRDQRYSIAAATQGALDPGCRGTFHRRRGGRGE